MRKDRHFVRILNFIEDYYTMMRNVTFKLGTVGSSKTTNWFNLRMMSVPSPAALRDEQARPDSADENDVLIDNVNNSGIVTLNRPKTINALTESMIQKIYAALKEWEGTKKLVIMKGAGKNMFCGGGDVKIIISNLNIPAGRIVGQTTFRKLYELNHLVGTYKTPYVAILNGITMGAGAGLCVHGPYRIATENTLFAMPETSIGLSPDAGGTFFLPRLKGKLGYYLGLTGHRLKGTDALLGGIATHYVPSERLEDLTKELLESNSEDIDGTIKKYQPDNFNPKFTLSPYLKQIDNCFSAPTMEEVLHRLEADGSDWALKTLKLLGKMSPTSLCVTIQALERGRRQSLAECLNMEFRLISAALTRNGDFCAGVRALLIDQDRKPAWKPKLLSQVSLEAIEARFARLPEAEELKLQ